MTAWPDALKLFFFGFWMFFGIYYGDVLYIAQQHSFFSTAQGAMRPLWETSYGSLWIIGRALLQAFHSPFWGGALLSGMLTLISWLFGYVFRLRGRFGYLKYIPAFVFIYVVVYHGFDVYYQAETGKLLGIPFCILLKPPSFVLSVGKNSRGCSPHRLTTVRSTNGKPWDSSSSWEPVPWV